MIKYVFLDLDDTLFDFKAAEARALSGMLDRFGIPYSDELIARYSAINKSQWEELETGRKTRDEVLTDRFRIFFSEINSTLDPLKAREVYENLLGEGHFFIDGAEDLLQSIHKDFDLYLASNGTASVQRRRIASSDISRYFKDIFISQEIGYDKPSEKYFSECFLRIPGFSRDKAIIIGDSLSSDIRGGRNAGILTCHYNPNKKPKGSDINADFEVFSLGEIPALLRSL